MERFLVNAAEQVDEPPAPIIAACDILKQSEILKGQDFNRII